jgi:predicted alpha/beta-hydrolase family hydrolase
MQNEPETLTINVNENDAVTAVLYPAPKKNRVGVTVILGHGAGASQLSGFMQIFAKGLAALGLDVMTFNFVYMEQKRSVPDQMGKLASCYRAVIDAALKHKKLKSNRLVIGGKSMGGRIASLVAAAAADARDALDRHISGLVFLGYPLHPPGAPEKLRVEHWPNIKVPLLFVQGTRDPLGTPDEITPFIQQFKLPATIHTIEGGDHSLKAPKKFGISQNEIYDMAMDEIVRWAAAIGLRTQQ